MLPPTMVGETGREMYGIQSLEWNCNDGQLYWGWSNNPNNNWWITSYVLQVDPNTGATQEFGYLFSDPIPALFIFDLKRNDRWDSSRYPAVDTAARLDMPATLSLLRKRNPDPACRSVAVDGSRPGRNLVQLQS